jgi:hypothetical protein
MQRFRDAWEWACEDDWRWLRCFVAIQIASVVGFLYFATWIAEYARGHWY